MFCHWSHSFQNVIELSLSILLYFCFYINLYNFVFKRKHNNIEFFYFYFCVQPKHPNILSKNKQYFTHKTIVQLFKYVIGNWYF